MTLIREITEKMINKALEDSRMTKDEYELIKKVQLDYSIYSNELEKAMEDGVISDKEHKTLQKIKVKLYEDALKKAMEDGTITDDERAILDLIKEHVGLSEDIINENELIKKIENKLK